ncbi:unnamed protein product [Rotaria magnacalcarata]|uniref:Cupin 2 conserved barrel domain-containing protein n=1 Tax=Rotaria magnacalcarata TaxID=392030 RepID=A0A814MDI1_9BILA|nr:unnamed protein product [Rotaria magnacalcarata]CAF1482832.1 unnamed protein product [Rotaria magnacalcarata]CAF2089671.1 unnamed protein product [Rotaria magnacalcarata]CAF2164910.1 unnamed protein product [Rotaria magnacalcarata]
MCHVILAVGFSFVCLMHSVSCVMALDQDQPININGSLFIEPGVGKSFRALAFPNATRTFKLRGNQTGNLFTLIEGKILIGEGPKLHLHHNEDETFRIISGQVQFIIGNETFCAPAGSVVYGKRGIENYFDEVSAVYTTVPYDDNKANAIANKYGMDMFGMPDWKDIGCILTKTPYRGQPVDIWSCGIILTTILTGSTLIIKSVYFILFLLELPWIQPSYQTPEYKR